MEKFRKFDDPRCGVNPFVPLKENPRPSYLLIPRLVSLYSTLTSLYEVTFYVLIRGKGAVYYVCVVFYVDFFVLEVCCCRACASQIIGSIFDVSGQQDVPDYIRSEHNKNSISRQT